MGHESHGGPSWEGACCWWYRGISTGRARLTAAEERRSAVATRVPMVCSPASDAFRDATTPSTRRGAEVREFTALSTPTNSVSPSAFFKKMKALGLRRGQSES